jgi:hypothetical protein
MVLVLSSKACKELAEVKEIERIKRKRATVLSIHSSIAGRG